MTKIQELNQKNDVNIHDVHSDAFRSYGRVIEGYDIAPLLSYMREHTEIPETGNVYVPSVPEMEEYPIFEELQSVVYGGMPIQMGYCNGRNTTYNGFEYHKGSEINIAVTDFMLVLGHSYDIEDNTYHAKDAVVFYVPEGTVIEMYQTTLHLSPLRVSDCGFRDIVVLPRGTNTPLKERMENPVDEESVLLLQTNKWVICHPDREPLVKQGAHTGMLGENKELYY